jgi:hypothetical protein
MYAIENNHKEIVEELEKVGAMKEGSKSKYFRSRLKIIANNANDPEMTKLVEVRFFFVYCFCNVVRLFCLPLFLVFFSILYRDCLNELETVVRVNFKLLLGR